MKVQQKVLEKWENQQINFQKKHENIFLSKDTIIADLNTFKN